MPTSLRGIANKASSDEHHRFRNLFGLLTVTFLLSCWERVNKKAVSGVDRVSAQSYAKDLEGNVRDLWDRVKRGSYRAKLVRRSHIPKEGGRTRPLGILVVEDKLLQVAVSRILNAIYEPIFLACSWAYRLGRDAREAVRTLTQELQFGCYGYLVEIDIKGFFDRIDHDKLLQLLELRIDDRPFLRLIWKWLKAGVLEEGGKVIHPETGCPQGSGISPVLANIYLHYVLDLWFTEVVKPRCKARAFMCRYADDVVFAFQWFEDAERFFRGVAEAAGEVRVGAVGGEEPDGAVQPIPTGQGLGEVRLPRVRVPLGGGPQGSASGNPSDVAQAASSVVDPSDRVDQGRAALAGSPVGRVVEHQASWAL